MLHYKEISYDESIDNLKNTKKMMFYQLRSLKLKKIKLDFLKEH